MGNSGSLEVKQVSEFRRLTPSYSTLHVEIPEIPENRKLTDKLFLIIFIVFAIFLIPCLGYALAKSDIRRINLYDQYGNLCGYSNKKYDKWEHTGENMESKPYLKFQRRNLQNKTEQELLLEPRDCVSDCGQNYIAAFHRCIWTGNGKNSESVNVGDGITAYLKEVARDLAIIWWRIVLAIIACILICTVMIFIFRYAVAAFVWGSLISILLLLVAASGALWFAYFKADGSNDQKSKNNKQGLLIIASIITIITLIVICIFVFMMKKVKLVILLLKETAKAIFSMPMIFSINLLTFFAQTIILILFIFTTILITTSGTLQELREHYLGYVGNVFITFTGGFNFFIFLWSSQLILGIQYMSIAGGISKWFFAQNKEYLGSPLTTSVSNVFKFHLGSIAFGSLIITIVTIIRELIKGLSKNQTVKAIVDCILGTIEEFIKYLSKNAYIITAMHGQGFYRSGKRAAKLILQNVVNIVAINSIGDFVLGMAQFLVILLSVLFSILIFHGAEVTHIYIAYLIVGLFSLLLAVTVFSTFETAIDTIFICFCEDMLMNDGMVKPYAMSKGLMEFIEKSKSVLGEKEVPPH